MPDRLTRDVLAWWVLLHVAALWVAALVPRTVGDGTTVPAYDERWLRWDVRLYAFIAQYGYDGPPDEPGQYAAFFPGLPLLLRAVHIFVPNWVAAGLLVSLVAGGFGVVALARIATLDDPVNDAPVNDDRGRRAALALMLSPFGWFLATGYSEALFLGLALPAWLMARRGRWAGAGLLAAGACATRISGLFLVAALAVHLVTDHLAERSRGTASRVALARRSLWLAVAALPVAGYFGYLWARTGHWNAYLVAEQAWGRRRVGVWQTFQQTVELALNPTQGALTLVTRLELGVFVVGVVLVGLLLVRRRWAEATFVGLPLALLAPMSTYASVGRTGLTWWPLWVGLATAAGHPRWGTTLTRVYLGLSVPLALLLLAAFTMWHWAG